jgi:hypothetical protein
VSEPIRTGLKLHWYECFVLMPFEQAGTVLLDVNEHGLPNKQR